MCRRSRASPRGPGSASAARMHWPRRSMAEVLDAGTAQTPGLERVERRRLEIWLPLVIVVLDQLSKAAVRATLPLHESVTIIPGLMDFTHVRNTGAAFGILNLAEFP